jgi:UDP:flavonoid glycosyltransferase YjiC (YdhE family)
VNQKPLKVVCYVPSFNAGDTTRGIEVVRALVAKAKSRGRETDVTFVCPPIESKHFEALIARAGFRISHTAVPLSEADIDGFMNADRTGAEFVPEYDRARLYIEKYMEDMRSRAPDLVVNGCIPPAGVAAQILGLPTVTYLPFPADKAWARRHLIKDIPDPLENGFTVRLPRPLRRGLTALVSRLFTKQSFFLQPTTARAGRDLGWQETDPNIFTMLKADVELVNELPDYFRGQDLGPRARVTGPLFSRPEPAPIDPRILEVFRPEHPNKVLVTMGSSGEKSFLIESAKAVCTGEFHAVIVVQPTICTIAELMAQVKVPANVYLTDSFIPSHQVNPLADAALIHGGQGTVQTAVYSATPAVGVGMQAEQQGNLDNLAFRGAGIRIARRYWKAEAIRRALRTVLQNPEYKRNAAALSESFARIDGYDEAGKAIWALVEARGL